jgi:hypothetical protein
VKNVGASTSRNPKDLHILYRDNFTLTYIASRYRYQDESVENFKIIIYLYICSHIQLIVLYSIMLQAIFIIIWGSEEKNILEFQVTDAFSNLDSTRPLYKYVRF